MTKHTNQRFLLNLSIALLTIAVGARVAEATIVIGIRTPEEVVIAADSMGTFRGLYPDTAKAVCKVFTVGNVGFAISGLTKSPRGGLDAEAVIACALLRRRSIFQAITAIETELRVHISQELERQKHEEPKLFPKSLEGEDGSITSILLGAFEGDVPVAVGVNFRASQDPTGKISVSTSRLTCSGDCPSGVLTFYLGNRSPIEEYFRKHGKDLNMPPAEAARFLAQLVIDARVPGVGPPIDVLVISKSGISWQALKHGCGGMPSGFQDSVPFHDCY